MSAYITRRLFSMVFVWIGVTLLTFLLANVVPSDPVALRLGPKATPEAITYWRHQLGLDLPLWQQYGRFIAGLLHGDLGTSIWSGRPVVRDLLDYLPGTLELAVSGIVLAALAGIPLGIIATQQPGSAVDQAIHWMATAGLALPSFWLGLVLQIIFYRQLGWLPLDSRIDLFLGAPPARSGLYLLDSLLSGDLVRLGNSITHLILPTITLALPAMGSVARMTRASVLDALGEDYVRTATAKGASARRVLWRHVLRNALLPVVTLISNTFNAMLAGVFVVEVIFNWPGLGWYATRVILAADYASVVSITLVIGILCTLVNFAVDLLYRKLDPRIQLT